jgi:hypothetical protein
LDILRWKAQGIFVQGIFASKMELIAYSVV